MAVEKYIKDGKVAVLYSPGYGAGWSTWDEENAEGMLFDKDIVEAVMAGDVSLAENIAEQRYNAYAGGVDSLTIEWLDVGTLFRINEYDGYESIEIYSDKSYNVA